MQQDTFISHLVELCERLVRAVGVVLVLFAIFSFAWPGAGAIYDFLAAPLMHFMRGMIEWGDDGPWARLTGPQGSGLLTSMARADALLVIPAERLVLSSDCGMGREGMSRRHAFYKMVALVQGTNIVRKELGLPLAQSLGADPKFSLIRTK